jgi:hypothetical protein
VEFRIDLSVALDSGPIPQSFVARLQGQAFSSGLCRRRRLKGLLTTRRIVEMSTAPSSRRERIISSATAFDGEAPPEVCV